MWNYSYEEQLEIKEDYVINCINTKVMKKGKQNIYENDVKVTRIAESVSILSIYLNLK